MTYICILIAPILFILTFDSSFGESIAEPADEQAVTVVSQKNTDESEAASETKSDDTTSDDPGILFSLWAAIAAVLGFGFGGLLALRARAKAKAEKNNNQQ